MVSAASKASAPASCAAPITANIRNMNWILGGDPDGKVLKLLEFAGTSRSVDDPWYTGDFETTYADVRDGCEGLLAYLGM